MAEQRGASKGLSLLITVAALLLTVASTTYAVAAGSVIKKEELLEERVKTQEIQGGIVITKIDNMKEQLNKIEGLLSRHIEGGAK